MRYIDRILQPGEKVLFHGRLHWLIYFPGALMLLPVFGALAVSAHAQQDSSMVFGGLIVALVFGVLSGAMLLSEWFRRWTTEIDVTDRRVVYKRGFVKRHTVELNMDKVASVDVDQSIMGRILNYGDITIHSTGNEIEPLRGIGHPLEFRNQVTAR